MKKKADVGQETPVIPLPEGILPLVVQDLLDNNGQIQQLELVQSTMKKQKDIDAIQKQIEKVSADVKALKESDLKVVKQEGNKYVIDAGRYGYRKITL